MEPLFIDLDPEQRASKAQKRILLIVLLFIIFIYSYLIYTSNDNTSFIVSGGIADVILLIFFALSCTGLGDKSFFNVDDEGIEYKYKMQFFKKQIKWDLVERIEFRQWKVWFYMKNSKCRKINLDRIQPLTTSVMIKEKMKEYGRLKGIQMSATEIKK